MHEWKKKVIEEGPGIEAESCIGGNEREAKRADSAVVKKKN